MKSGRLKYRNEILALALLLALVPVLPLLSSGGPSSVPFGVAVSGVVPGASLAMQAIAIVLVYRANRFINIGQFYLGFIGASVFVLSSQYLPLYRWINNACPACIGTESTSLQYTINYWLSAAVGLGLSVLAAWLMYVVVVKRFEGKPRLVLMVASIFVAPAAIAIVGLMRNTLTTVQDREDGLLAVVSPLPFTASFKIGPAVFQAADILTVVLATLTVGGLFAFLRYSPTGMAIRASSENTRRAELLGMNVNRINTRVWLIVGLLSGIAALLQPMGSTPLNFEAVTVGGTDPRAARRSHRPLREPAARGRRRARHRHRRTVGAVELQRLERALRRSAGRGGRGSPPPPGPPARTSRPSCSTSRAGRRPARFAPYRASCGNSRRCASWLRSLGTVGLIVVLGLPWALSPAQTNLAAVAFIYGIIGLSLLVLTGWSGQVSLGQFAFAAIGGYVVAVWDAPDLLDVAHRCADRRGVAALVGIPALRLRGLYLAISTMALAVSVTTLLLSPRYLGSHLPDNVGRPSSLGVDLEDQRSFYYFSLVSLGRRGGRGDRSAPQPHRAAC